MNHSEREIRRKLLEDCQGYNLRSLDFCMDKRLKEISSSLIGCNNFVTAFDFKQYKFISRQGVQGILGYTNKEFTIGNLCNLNNLNICHPDDVQHAIRYNTIVCRIVMSGVFPITTLKDYYKLTFRVFHKDGSILTAVRKMHLFTLTKENKPETHLDIWEISNKECPHVTMELMTEDKEKSRKANEKLYEENIKILRKLEIPVFSIEECQILEYKSEGMSDVEVSRTMKKTDSFTRNTIAKMNDRIKVYLEDDKSIEVPSKLSVKFLINFANTHAILPLPSQAVHSNVTLV